MATPDTRLTYGSFTDKHGHTPTLEEVEDGMVMCACGATLSPLEFEFYGHSCERCEKRTDHEYAPVQFEKNFETDGVRRIPERKRTGGEAGGSSAPPSMAQVIEIPAGKYDAVRTLRHCLSMAERGVIDDVVLVCTKKGEPMKPAEGDDIWMTWSDMPRWSVWWYVGWAQMFIYRRYFHDDGPDEHTDQAG